MTINLESVQDLFLRSGHGQSWLVAAGCALLVLLAALAFLVWRRRSGNEKKISRAMSRIGEAVLHKIVIPDGMDSIIYLDYLLLTPHGLLVIDVMDYKGLLFGGERTDTWTQIVGKHSYKFENPLYQNEARVASVRALLPKIPVRGCVVFTNDGRFPRTRPANVYMLDALNEELKGSLGKTAIPPDLRDAWERLKMFAKHPDLRAAVFEAPEA
jgi:hypothetical protein